MSHSDAYMTDTDPDRDLEAPDSDTEVYQAENELPPTGAEIPSGQPIEEHETPPASPSNVLDPVTPPFGPSNALVPVANTTTNRKRKHVREPSNSSTDNSPPRKINKSEAKKLATKKFEPAELEKLSVVTVLPVREEVAAPPVPEPTGTWLLSIPFGSRRKNVDHSITLNPCGDATVTIRKINSGDEGAEPQYEYIKCALASLREAATGPQWIEMLKTGTVSIPAEDDTFGILFVLRVAHNCDLSKVYPKKLGIEEIVKITSIVQKYDASSKVRRELVARIPSEWRANATAFSLRRRSGDWLFVSWELGFHESFAQVMRWLIRRVQTNDRGELFDEEDKPLKGTFPTAVLDYIKQTRMRYVAKLLNVTYDYADQLRDPNFTVCSAPDRHHKNSCAAVLCGKFYQGIAKNGLPGSKPDAGTFGMSVNALEKILKNIDGHRPRDQKEPDSPPSFPSSDSLVSPSSPSEVHPDCQRRSAWFFMVNRELRDIDQVPDLFQQWLERQRSKWEQVEE